ncbi:MAG: metal-dependent transcriptional regulator [Clostridia bacterium]|nr:metal-dependent transcriptional regulator [Clostridia bacterium]
MNIRKSAEDYLEMILMLGERKGVVRSVDIAAGLNVTKPSVSVAMKRLRENGYLLMGEDNAITLTESGHAIASAVYARHKTLTRFFEHIGVDSQTAREDACKVKHDISEDTYRALVAYLERADEQA